MGYTSVGSITNYWPDDEDNKIYVADDCGLTVDELMSLAKEKWEDASLENIVIGAEHVHTNCIYYDRYDSGDYTMFVTINYNGKL